MGHAGAGSFSREVFVLDCVTGKAEAVEVSGEEEEGPEPRGWGAGATTGPNSGVFFGGLAGSDKDPRRLGDCWTLLVE